MHLNAGEKYYIKMGVGIYSNYSPNIPAYRLKIEESAGSPESFQLRFLNESAISSKQISFGVYFTPINTYDEIVKIEVSDESILQLYDSTWGVTTSQKVVFDVVGEGKVIITATSESGLTASYTYYAVLEGACDDGHDYDENHECVRCGAIGGICGENLTWTFEQDSGALTVCGTGKMDSFSLALDPAVPWAALRGLIKKVILEEGVTEIGAWSFCHCIELTQIEFPDSLKCIREGVFTGCSTLEEVKIPSGVDTMEGWIFNGCKNLQAVTLPESLTVLEEGLFAGCSGIAEIKIPDSVNYIGSDVFTACYGLTDITIPSNVRSIGTAAFAECNGLKSITFQGDAPQFSVPPENPGYLQIESFNNVTATAYYPSNNSTWKSDVLQNYGGTITWVPYGTVKNRVTLDAEDLAGQTSVWIDGMEYAVQVDGDDCYVDIPDSNARTMVAYTYNSGSQNRYPIGMKVWILENTDGVYTATRAETFDNILQYSGMSIRVTGKKGVRMVTSIEKEKKNSLTSDGLSGYTLKEYGTVVAWASKLADGSPLALGQSYTLSNYAYKKGVADPVFAYNGSLMQYTNVLVNFTDEQCKYELALRPYMILEDAEGEEITLYGGIVNRSIGYIAYQNRNEFEPGTEEYNYIWDIIHYVYGDVYDDEFEHAWTTPKV